MNDPQQNRKDETRVSSESLELHQEKLICYQNTWFQRQSSTQIHFLDIESVHIDESDDPRVCVTNQNGTALFIETSSEQEANELKGAIQQRIIECRMDETDERIPLEEIETWVEKMIENLDETAPELANVLLKQGVLHHASDIHLKPTSHGLQINYRIDGFFHSVAELPASVSDQVMSRIKVMSRLTTYERHSAQEGRMTMEVNGRDRHFRVSIMPTIAGEKAVIRVFDVLRDLLELEELDFSPGVLDQFTSLISRPQGIILLTGPSSSGKTTTLYATLRKIYRNRGDRINIVSIEDPVEYNMEMWNQIQVNQTRGLSFADALSSALRMDPNVIMVGEIRDAETAHIATKASLSGHLIFSTVHSGSAAGVFNRLLDMGIEKHLVASSVTGALAQRLVRTVCDHCREEYTPETKVLDELGVQDELKGTQLQRGRGCSECHNTGYNGRTPLTELLVMDEEIKNDVLKKRNTDSIESTARDSGMKTLKEDGVSKVKQGTTTVEELNRVL